MKFLSYNVNGIRSACKKGLFDYIFSPTENFDIIALQEVKAKECQLETPIPQGWRIYFNSAERAGYSGTALFCKNKPLNVVYGLADFDKNQEGRVIAAEFDNYYFVCVYTPNAKHELLRLDYRIEWDKAFKEYMAELAKKKHVIITGDFNVAHNEIDLANPDTNHFNPGFSDEERAGFSNLLDAGFVDTFRYFNPTKQEYSWYSYRFNARSRGIGWRIDYFLIDKPLIKNVKSSCIIQTLDCSDHMPVVMECDL